MEVGWGESVCDGGENGGMEGGKEKGRGGREMYNQSSTLSIHCYSHSPLVRYVVVIVVVWVGGSEGERERERERGRERGRAKEIKRKYPKRISHSTPLF